MSAAGVHRPAGKHMDGADLLPVLRGERTPFPRTVFWRFKRAQVRRKAVRSGDWKYVWDNGAEELHNLADDPGEAKDQLRGQPKITADLRAKVAAWEVDVRAPRLRDFPSGRR